MTDCLYKRFKCCLRCSHYEPTPPERQTQSGQFFTTGDCRRNAPSLSTNSQGVVRTQWPQVRSYDYCGDFDLEESQVEPTQYALDLVSQWAVDGTGPLTQEEIEESLKNAR